MMAVSDLQRMAAVYMGINKDWVRFVPEQQVNCPFCTILMPPAAIVCPNCREVVDRVRYDALKGVASGS